MQTPNLSSDLYTPTCKSCILSWHFAKVCLKKKRRTNGESNRIVDLLCNYFHWDMEGEETRDAAEEWEGREMGEKERDQPCI